MTVAMSIAVRVWKDNRPQRISAQERARQFRLLLINATPEEAKPIVDFCLQHGRFAQDGYNELRFFDVQEASRQLGYPSAAQFKTALWKLRQAWSHLAKVSTRKDVLYKIQFRSLC